MWVRLWAEKTAHNLVGSLEVNLVEWKVAKKALKMVVKTVQMSVVTKADMTDNWTAVK